MNLRVRFWKARTSTRTLVHAPRNASRPLLRTNKVTNEPTVHACPSRLSQTRAPQHPPPCLLHCDFHKLASQRTHLTCSPRTSRAAHRVQRRRRRVAVGQRPRPSPWPTFTCALQPAGKEIPSTLLWSSTSGVGAGPGRQSVREGVDSVFLIVCGLYSETAPRNTRKKG